MKQDKVQQHSQNADIETYVPLCPVCGRELHERTDDGYPCSCGEVIPIGMEIIPHRGLKCRTLGRWGK